NNTSGPVNVASKTVNFVGNDGIDPSATSVATITIAPLAIDLNGLVAGTGHTTFWKNTGAVNTTLNTATIVDAKAANLSQLTVSITAGADVNNLLSATTVGAITSTYNAGTGVLTLSGTDTIANYQTVLRSVKYNNTGGGPGAAQVNMSYVATDTLGSNSTANGVVKILTATGGVVARNLFYNNSGTASPLRYDGANAAINADDDAAIAIDKVAYL